MSKRARQSGLPTLDDFLLYIQSNNYSERTLYNYERDLRTFERFLAEDMDNLPFTRITKRTIEQYKAYLHSRDRKTADGSATKRSLRSGSINRALTSLRRYLAYLAEMGDGAIPVAPECIRLLRLEKRHPRIAELEEIQRLIEAPMTFERDPVVALRNRAALETLFASGMRISELISLQRNQIDRSGKIFIRGKGRKQRFIYLTERAKRHIRNYLAKRHDDFPYLFIPKRGSNAGDREKHISANYLQMRIKQYRELLGINVPTSAHSLRHGFATYLAEQGANPAAIQILLGHESLETTTRYVHASDRYAEAVHKKFHPLKE